MSFFTQFRRTGTCLACGFFCACLVATFRNDADAQTAIELEPIAVTDPADRLIPQLLLPCVHAKEVQAELKLSSEQIEKLEAILAELDQRWWPSRILEVEKRRALVQELENELLKRMTDEISPESVQRLQQLELQAQGPRLLLRPDVAAQLGFSAEQQKKFRDLAVQAEQNLAELNANKDERIVADRPRKAAMIRNDEIQAGYAEMSETQKSALRKLLGTMLDFSQMERIYPIAPELIDSTEWIGSAPPSLRELKGKVVIVHFYAFECENCRRNFAHYNDWAIKFKDQDVVFIGIQTPETAAESDPTLVRAAAERDKFEFPVLIDLGKKNWDAWGNTMWPTVYIIDKRGYIRLWWQGELNWQGATGDQTVIETINKLLKD